MLPKPNRLAHRREFSAVYNRKKSWANSLLALYVLWHRKENLHSETRRFGFSVSKKVGKAHDRNGVKRRLREICRLVGITDTTETWKHGFDAVFVARTESANASYADLESAVRELGKRAGLTRATVYSGSVSTREDTET